MRSPSLMITQSLSADGHSVSSVSSHTTIAAPVIGSAAYHLMVTDGFACNGSSILSRQKLNKS